MLYHIEITDKQLILLTNLIQSEVRTLEEWAWSNDLFMAAQEELKQLADALGITEIEWKESQS